MALSGEAGSRVRFFYVEKMLSHIAERSWTAFPMGKEKTEYAGNG